MAKYRVLFARFPGNRVDDPDCTDWLVRSIVQAKADPRISNVLSVYKSDTPITMTRNQVCEAAKAAEADFVVMVDNDMYPDMYWKRDPKARPFFPLALDFLVNHNGPGMIAVPYCGPPPTENIYVFRWATSQSDHPNIDLKIDQYSREEAADAEGIEEVAALPTGLCMFHTKCLDFLSPPYFEYEWKKGSKGEDLRAEKASTEDVYFSRNLTFAGIPVYCAWDSWAGHWKRKCVGRPTKISVKDVNELYFHAARKADREEWLATGVCKCCGIKRPPPPAVNREAGAVAAKAAVERAKVESLEIIGSAMEEKYTEPAAQRIWAVTEDAGPTVDLPQSCHGTTGWPEPFLPGGLVIREAL